MSSINRYSRPSGVIFEVLTEKDVKGVNRHRIVSNLDNLS